MDKHAKQSLFFPIDLDMKFVNGCRLRAVYMSSVLLGLACYHANICCVAQSAAEADGNIINSAGIQS